MFYITENDTLKTYCDEKYDERCLETDIITQKELEAHPSKVKVEDGILVLNPDWEEEEAEQEAIRVGNLTCTKRVFVLMLEQLGYDYYERIEPLIASNRQAKLEWDLCVELQRKNPLIDLLASEVGVTSEQLDNLFKFANGEITQEQFLGE